MSAVSNIELYNAIRSSLSDTFKSRMPEADATNISTLGQMLTAGEFQAQYNEWLGALLDRIGLVLFRESQVRNRLSWTYMDKMEYGRFIQEIGMNLIKATDYNMPTNGGTLDPFKVNNPDVEALMYQLNSKRKYLITVNVDLVKRAFTNAGGVDSLISSIVSMLTKSSEIDRWISIKETFNQFINGTDNLKLKKKPSQEITVAGIATKEDAIKTITDVATVVTDMGFVRTNYNEAGIPHMLDPEDLVLFIRQEALQFIDKNVLAFAFNRGDLTIGERVRIEPMDDFGGLIPMNESDETMEVQYNTEGMVIGYKDPTSQEVSAQPAKWSDPNINVVAVLMDRRRLMVVNNLLRSDSIFNPSGLYTNYYLHDWNLFTQSGMMNGVVFKTAGEGEI